MRRLLRRRQLRRQGRRRLAQFQRVNAINAALHGEDWLTLNELLDIDYELVASMSLDEWQQTVIVRLHDFAAELGIEYKWNNDKKGNNE